MSFLTTKVLGWTSIALLIALAGLSFMLWRANEKLDKEQLRHKATAADRDRFKDALAFYANDGQIRIGRGRQALKEREPVSAELRRQADRIRTVRVSGEGCETPAEVREAAGL